MSSNDLVDQTKRDTSSVKIDLDLEKFYAKHNVELSDLKDSSFPYRFVRCNPRYDRKETLKMLTEELQGKTEPIQVSWLDKVWGFYALPPDFSLATSKCFKSGRIYGMDVSSGAAAAALLSEMYDQKKRDLKSLDTKDDVRVLDLCCCPGLKLCMLSDQMRSHQKKATIVGVDVSEMRMNLCKKIVTKYQIDTETCGSVLEEGVKIQLYCQDGTSFGMDPERNNLVFDSRAVIEEMAVRGKRKRMNKSARAREKKRLRLLASEDWIPAEENNDKPDELLEAPSIMPFDYVLVDAECSTDGSLKHLKERLKDSETNGGEEKNTMLTDGKQLANLVELQKRLIESGYHLLKPGGTMIYSTCSLSHDQNEKVVQWLLDTQPNSFLIPVQFPMAKSRLVVEGTLQGTVRFCPNLGNDSSEFFGDGFFLAKLGKR